MDFPFTLAPGQTITVNSRQAYLYYEAGSAGGADASIRVSADIGDEIVLKPGQGFRYTGPFNRLYLSNNKGQGTIIGHILMEAGEFFDNRVTGSVEVVDGGKNRTSAAIAYSAMGYAVPVAGAFASVQLWNPAGSGVNLVLENIVMASNATGQVFARRSVAPLANLYLKGTNKKLGPTNIAGKAEVRNETPVTQPGDTSLLAFGAQLNANTSFIFNPKEPIVITPGAGLVVISFGSAGTGNSDMLATFEWYEDPL